MGWIDITSLVIGIIAVVVGIAALVVGIRHKREARRVECEAKVKGDHLVAFLHGLKASNLSPKAEEQVNDMLGRLDPARGTALEARRGIGLPRT